MNTETISDTTGTVLVPVQTVKGQLVQRKVGAKKLYRVVGYCRYEKKWQLDDQDDISRCIYVKSGTLVVVD
jgi:hypothetical protein